MASDPTTQAGRRLLNYHRSYSARRCGVHEDELAPILAEAEAEAAQQARALADELAGALRDAIDIAHETDSLRSHSDDERKDGWFRAPFYRCEDATCLDARSALAKWGAYQSDK